MNFKNTLTDQAVLQELGKRIAQYRINANLTQKTLANEAGIATRTLERLEAGHSIQLSSLIRILRSLELLTSLSALVPDAGPRPMDLLKMKGKKRRRASSPRKSNISREPWTWADPS
jgi:transcriptional regulator with XRE-family HTH domain